MLSTTTKVSNGHCIVYVVSLFSFSLAFSNYVYGEINASLVNEFITKTNITSKSVFMDLGCGIGNVVLQVAAQTGCESYGIEIMETPCKLAKRQLKEYATRMK